MILDAVFVLAELLIDLSVIQLEHGHVAPEVRRRCSGRARPSCGATNKSCPCRCFITSASLCSRSSWWSWLGRSSRTAWSFCITSLRCLTAWWWWCPSSWTSSSSFTKTRLMQWVSSSCCDSGGWPESSTVSDTSGRSSAVSTLEVRIHRDTRTLSSLGSVL